MKLVQYLSVYIDTRDALNTSVVGFKARSSTSATPTPRFKASLWAYRNALLEFYILATSTVTSGRLSTCMWWFIGVLHSSNMEGHTRMGADVHAVVYWGFNSRNTQTCLDLWQNTVMSRYGYSVVSYGYIATNTMIILVRELPYQGTHPPPPMTTYLFLSVYIYI